MPDTRDYNRCPFCQGNIEPDFKVCPLCGARIIKTCEGCGKDVRVQWTLCPYCGRHIFGPEHYLETAQKRLESGNHTEALRYVLYARGLFPGNDELQRMQEKIQFLISKKNYETLIAQAQEYEKAGYLHAAIDAYSKAQAIKADASISQRIEFLRSRLEEENKKGKIELAKSYEEKARACEKEGKLKEAIGLYEKAYITYKNARIQKKIDELKENIQRRKKRRFYLAFAIGGTIIFVAITLLILFLLGIIGGMKNHNAELNVINSEEKVAFVYLKCGDMYYCEAEDGEIIRNDLLVDEIQDISFFDVDASGNTILYITQDTLDNIEGPKKFFLYKPGDSSKTAHLIETYLTLYSIGIYDADNIWFSAGAGGPGSRTCKYQISNANICDITHGDLIDLNIKEGTLLLRRHEYNDYGSNDKIYLTDLSGNVIRDMGSYFSDSPTIIPCKWSFDEKFIVAMERTFKDKDIVTRLLLLDSELKAIETFDLPEEYSNTNNCDWYYDKHLLLFSVSGKGLYLADTKGDNVITCICEGEVFMPRFINPFNITTNIQDKPNLTSADREQIENIIYEWFKPALECAKGNYGFNNYRLIWSLLADGGPYKEDWINSYRDCSFDELMEHFEIIMAETCLPLNSYKIDSIDYDGEKVVAKCTCDWPAVDNAIAGVFPARITMTEFIIIRQKGDWKIYDVKE